MHGAVRGPGEPAGRGGALAGRGRAAPVPSLLSLQRQQRSGCRGPCVLCLLLPRLLGCCEAMRLLVAPRRELEERRVCGYESYVLAYVVAQYVP